MMAPAFVRSSLARLPFTSRLVGFSLLAVFGALVSCSDDEADGGGGGGSGMAGGGGAAGSGMAGGSGGMAGGAMVGGATAGGDGGMAGGAMAGGNGGMAGGMAAVGMGGSAMAAGGGTGFIEVISDASDTLRGPTTAAIVDEEVWVAEGQLAQLFEASPAPVLPFRVVAIPLAGGPIARSVDFNLQDFFLEGVAASRLGTLYIGGVTRGQILTGSAASSNPVPFMDAASAERGVIGLAVDEPRSLLWYCDSNPAGPAGGAVVAVQLEAGNTEVVRHELPNNLLIVPPPVADAGADAGAADAGAPVEVPPFCNDLIVLPPVGEATEGDLLISDSSGRLFRIAAGSATTPNSAEVWLAAPELEPAEPGGFGVNGLDLVGTSLIVANGSLIQLDPASADPASTLRVLTLTEGGAAATLCGPDGLAAVPGTSDQVVVVENGFCPAALNRVVKVTLDLN